MQQAGLEKILADLPLGGVRFFDRIGSTNLEAARWSEAGAHDLALVVADEQTAGRGRMERRWFTPPGVALAFSLVLRPEALPFPSGANSGPAVLATQLPRLTALGALGVSDALRSYGLRPEIKWPNDVLLGRRKTAGVLVEAHWQGGRLLSVIIGIGVNVKPRSVPPPEELNFPATCVETAQKEAGIKKPVTRMALLHAVLAHLLFWRSLLSEPEFLQAWEERLALRGEWVQIIPTAPAKEASPPVEGRVLGLDHEGALRLAGLNGEILNLQTGEIRLHPLER